MVLPDESSKSTGQTCAGGTTLRRFLPTLGASLAKAGATSRSGKRKGELLLGGIARSGELTSFAVASPANPLAALDAALEKRINAGSGMKCEEFARYSDQHGCWLKTSQGFSQRVMFTESGAPSSEELSMTWPRSGIVSNGIAYRRRPLVPRISGRGCSFWPTPDGAVANLGERPETVLKRREQQKQRHLNGNGFGLRLTTAVQMWPTPRQTDGSRGGRVTARKSRWGGNLVEAVAKVMFPTPNSTDYKGPSIRSPGKERPSCNDDLPTRIGGQLNADWVSILMGFPANWTVVEDGSAECRE